MKLMMRFEGEDRSNGLNKEAAIYVWIHPASVFASQNNSISKAMTAIGVPYAAVWRRHLELPDGVMCKTCGGGAPYSLSLRGMYIYPAYL